jgi:hypothetical protein
MSEYPGSIDDPSELAMTSSCSAASTRLGAEERDELSGHALSVVDERPVAALGQDHDLRSGEESCLEVGESQGDVGVLCSRDDERRRVRVTQRTARSLGNGPEVWRCAVVAR